MATVPVWRSRDARRRLQERRELRQSGDDARGANRRTPPDEREGTSAVMLTPIAGHLSLHRMRKLLASAGPPLTVLPRPAARRGRRARRVGSRAPRHWLRRTTAVPSAAFDLEVTHRLTTPHLWSVWTVAHLESEIAWIAWRSGPREHRARARRAYRAALAREERAALLLAERAGLSAPTRGGT
jgi:hypothetical protein